MEVRLRDYITYKGERYYLANNLLESYFKMHPEKRPFPDVFYLNAYKQYSATFEIKNSRVYLKEINLFRYCFPDSLLLNVNVINELFPNQNEFELKGINSDLVLNHVSRYVIEKHYINSLHIKIKSGEVVKVRRLNYSKLHIFINKLYRKFKKTDKYKTRVLLYDKSIYSKKAIKKYIKRDILDLTTYWD